MSDHTHDPHPAVGGGHAGLAFWTIVAACVPIVVVFALLALKVI